MSNRKKDLIDFLIEYLVVSNYSNSLKINNDDIKSKFKLENCFNKHMFDIKLNKYSNTAIMEQEYSNYKE